MHGCLYLVRSIDQKIERPHSERSDACDWVLCGEGSQRLPAIL